MIDFDELIQEELELLKEEEQDHIIDDTPDVDQTQPEQPTEPAPDEQDADQAPTEQPEQGGELPPMTQEELLQRQIQRNQDIFTKIYLLRRIEKLIRWMNNLKDVVNQHVDADAVKSFESYQTFLGVLQQVALSTETAALYHTIVQLEIELLEILKKLDVVDEKISEDLIDDSSNSDIHKRSDEQ